MSEQTRPDLFPIMSVNYDYDEKIRKLRAAGVQSIIIGVPWAILLPHERQAQSNHGQSLRRLAERGDLGVCEAVAILEDRRWHRMAPATAHFRLAELVAKFNADCARAEREGEP